MDGGLAVYLRRCRSSPTQRQRLFSSCNAAGIFMGGLVGSWKTPLHAGHEYLEETLFMKFFSGIMLRIFKVINSLNIKGIKL